MTTPRNLRDRPDWNGSVQSNKGKVYERSLNQAATRRETRARGRAIQEGEWPPSGKPRRRRKKKKTKSKAKAQTPKARPQQQQQPSGDNGGGGDTGYSLPVTPISSSQQQRARRRPRTSDGTRSSQSRRGAGQQLRRGQSMGSVGRASSIYSAGSVRSRRSGSPGGTTAGHVPLHLSLQPAHWYDGSRRNKSVQLLRAQSRGALSVDALDSSPAFNPMAGKPPSPRLNPQQKARSRMRRPHTRSVFSMTQTTRFRTPASFSLGE